MAANPLTNGKRPHGTGSQVGGAPPAKRKPSMKRRIAGAGRPVAQGTARGLALELLSWRRRREQLFGAHLFSEPVWDMMLDLLVHHEQGRMVNVTSLCVASMASFSTALRWIQAMENNGLDPTHIGATAAKTVRNQMPFWQSSRGRSVSDGTNPTVPWAR